MSESNARAWRVAARIGCWIVGLEFALAVALIVYAGVHDFHEVFSGTPKAAAARIEASCSAPQGVTPCDVAVEEVDEGRYRLATNVDAAQLTVKVRLEAADRPHHLLVRTSQPSRLRLDMTPPAGESATPMDVTEPAGRVTAVLPPGAATVISLTPPADAKPSRIVIDELAVFDRPDGLLSENRAVFASIPPSRYHRTLVPRAIASICLFTIVAALFVPPHLLKRLNPLVLAVVCFCLCLVDLAALFSPHISGDLRVFYTARVVHDVPGSNLNGGLWQGFNLLHGQGPTLVGGVVPWERMPGYGLFCGLAGALFGHDTMLDVAVSTVLAQIIFYSAAVGVFAWAASLLFPAAAVWAVGLLIAWLPKELGLTQVDAVIAPVALLVLGALCARLRIVRDGKPVPLALDVAVHATFGMWFAMRPDVLPGWLLVSLYLHGKDWRRLVIPAALFLTIGGTWGIYKVRHHREFALTTTSAGAALFCGLFEVPSRFRLSMACSDEAYFGWIRQHTAYDPQSAAASSFAAREVLKFWLTYPGHFVIMVFHKFMQVLNGDVWPGYPTQLQVFVFGVVPRFWIVLSLVTVLAASVVVGHEGERTLLLAWPLFLNAPLFWVMFASLGRFYSAVGVALVAASVPPLFEKAFYASMRARPWRALSVFAAAAVVAVAAWPFHAWLLRNDALHYWTPLLDPAASLLGAFN